MTEQELLKQEIDEVMRFIKENYDFFSIPVAHRQHEVENKQLEFGKEAVLNSSIIDKFADFIRLYTSCGFTELLKDYSDLFKNALQGMSIKVQAGKFTVSKFPRLLWEQGKIRLVIDNHPKLRKFILANKNHPAILFYKVNADTKLLITTINDTLVELNKFFVGRNKKIKQVITHLEQLKIAALTMDLAKVAAEYQALLNDEIIRFLNNYAAFCAVGMDKLLAELQDKDRFIMGIYPKPSAKLTQIIQEIIELRESYICGDISSLLLIDKINALKSQGTTLIDLLKHQPLTAEELAIIKQSPYREAKLIAELLAKRSMVFDSYRENIAKDGEDALSLDLNVIEIDESIMVINKVIGAKDALKADLNKAINSLYVKLNLIKTLGGSDGEVFSATLTTISALNINDIMSFAEVDNFRAQLKVIYKDSITSINQLANKLDAQINEAFNRAQLIEEKDKQQWQMSIKHKYYELVQLPINEEVNILLLNESIGKLCAIYQEISALLDNPDPEMPNRYSLFRSFSLARELANSPPSPFNYNA